MTEAELRVLRRKELIEFLNTYKVSAKKLAEYSGQTPTIISNFKTGQWEITKYKWGFIQSAMKKIIEELTEVDRIKRKNLILDYFLKSLEDHGNTIVMKKHCFAREDDLIEQLKEKGFNCIIKDTESDHYVVENKNYWKKLEVRK